MAALRPRKVHAGRSFLSRARSRPNRAEKEKRARGRREKGGRRMVAGISVTLTLGPGTRRELVARFLFTGSAVKPRGGACRKLKKTLRALESKFSRGTNIINHQFWVSSEEQHTRGAYYSWRVLFKRGRDGDSGRLCRGEGERARKRR